MDALNVLMIATGDWMLSSTSSLERGKVGAKNLEETGASKLSKAGRLLFEVVGKR